MITPAEQTCLLTFYQAALASGHIWPEFAAAEAVIESAWNTSRLASQFLNIFGRKVWAAGPNVIALPTREFFSGAWVTVNAFWRVFPSIVASFEDRMQILKTDSRYAAAIVAPDGPSYVREVSRVWSTDPLRAQSVMSIWNAHHQLFTT